MDFFIQSLKIEFISQIGDKKTAMLMILLPLGAFILSFFLPPAEMTSYIPVGITVPEESQEAKELLEYLIVEDNLVEFIVTDEETLEANVASGKWECGFVLDEDFDRNVKRGNYNNLFRLVVGEGSTMDGLVTEAVSSAMLSLVADDIGERYLDKIGSKGAEDGYKIDENVKFEIIPVLDEEFVLDGVNITFSNTVLQGFSAIILTVFSISFGDRLSKRFKESYFKRIKAVTGHVSLILPILTIEFLIMALFLILALTPLNMAFNFTAILFLFSMVSISYFVGQLEEGSSALILPFLPPIMAIVTPVLFDATAIFSNLKFVSYVFPATHYINAMAGKVSGNLWLIVLTILFLVFGEFVRFKKERSKII